MPTLTTPDDAVRAYINFLKDPSSARDTAAISATQASLSSSHDVLENLRLLTVLERLELADGQALRSAFVKQAKTWATTNDVSVAAFRSLGVNDIVLAEAGFDLGRGKKGAKKATSTNNSGLPRAASVSSSSIRQWALNQAGSFSMADCVAGAGGSLMTVKKVVSELVASTELRSVGQRATPGTRGRAPEYFQKA